MRRVQLAGNGAGAVGVATAEKAAEATPQAAVVVGGVNGQRREDRQAEGAGEQGERTHSQRSRSSSRRRQHRIDPPVGTACLREWTTGRPRAARLL